MKRLSLILATLALCGASWAEAQGLAGRISALADGAIRMSYAARPGVCGDGRSFVGDYTTPGGPRIYFYGSEEFLGSSGPDFRGSCLPGPVRVSLVKIGGSVSDLRLYVGGTWVGPAEDLGTVSPSDAAGYLLDLARTAPEGLASRAILGATLADGVQLTGRLIALAGDQALRPHVRERALRWLPDAAEREDALRQANAAIQTIARDAADLAIVRERAIRSLPEAEANDAFLRTLYSDLDVRSLKERVIRRLGESVSGENIAWLRARVVDASEVLALRDRAIRMLGGSLGERELLRRLYSEVKETGLRERILRVVGDQGDDASARWLQGIVENRAEPASLRERALRVLADRGMIDYVRAVYPRLDDPGLEDRAVRLVAESGDRESVAWLKAMLEDPAERLTLRDRAARLLAERGEIAYLRQAYRRMGESALKERLIRLVAESGAADNAAWLEGIARDEAEPSDLRDRAVRSLAEAGATTDQLIELYDSVKARPIRERLIRIFAQRRDRAAIDKLIAVAKTDPDEGLRRYAVRRLAETGDERAKQFLEETVRR